MVSKAVSTEASTMGALLSVMPLNVQQSGRCGKQRGPDRCAPARCFLGNPGRCRRRRACMRAGARSACSGQRSASAWQMAKVVVTTPAVGGVERESEKARPCVRTTVSS